MNKKTGLIFVSGREAGEVKTDGWRCPGRGGLHTGLWNQAGWEEVVDALQDNTTAGASHPPLLHTLTLNKAIIIEFHLNE